MWQIMMSIIKSMMIMEIIIWKNVIRRTVITKTIVQVEVNILLVISAIRRIYKEK